MIHLAIDPVALSLGPLAVRWHGLAVAAAVLLAVAVAECRARRAGLDGEHVRGGAVWAVAAGLLGARLLHVVDQLDFYLNNPAAILALHEGGAAVLGGVLLGSAAAGLYARRAALPFWPIADVAAPALALGLAAGRIGSLIAGDAAGAPATLPWAVVYDRADTLVPTALRGVPTHPYPVYELLWDLGIIAALALWGQRLRPDGLRFLAFLTLYAAGRLVLTFYRDERVVLWGLQHAQVVALLTLAVTLPLLARRWRERAPGG